MEVNQVRGGLSSRLRDGPGGPDANRSLPGVQQFHQTAFQPECVHARSGLLQQPARILGSLNQEQELPLKNQRILSEQPGPPRFPGAALHALSSRAHRRFWMERCHWSIRFQRANIGLQLSVHITHVSRMRSSIHASRSTSPPGKLPWMRHYAGSSSHNNWPENHGFPLTPDSQPINCCDAHVPEARPHITPLSAH